MYVSNLKVCVNERQGKNQKADFGNVQNLPFAFFPLSSHIISIVCKVTHIDCEDSSKWLYLHIHKILLLCER